jgi:uncharacterized protein YifN (PemK superfamily)
MAIQYHPEPGTILICDFHGFRSPEMLKRRPVVVISPRLRQRYKLCTVVPLSTTTPIPQTAYHYRLHTVPPLPEPYDSEHQWVKGDMVYTVSFDRLFLPFAGKDPLGNRQYDARVIDRADLRAGLGMSDLTGHL